MICEPLYPAYNLLGLVFLQAQGQPRKGPLIPPSSYSLFHLSPFSEAVSLSQTPKTLDRALLGHRDCFIFDLDTVVLSPSKLLLISAIAFLSLSSWALQLRQSSSSYTRFGSQGFCFSSLSQLVELLCLSYIL